MVDFEIGVKPSSFAHLVCILGHSILYNGPKFLPFISTKSLRIGILSAGDSFAFSLVRYVVSVGTRWCECFGLIIGVSVTHSSSGSRGVQLKHLSGGRLRFSSQRPRKQDTQNSGEAA